MPTLCALVRSSHCLKWSLLTVRLGVVLDPNVKLAYAEHQWDAKQIKGAIGRLEAVVSLFLLQYSNVF
jgi:hypothetical protein